jgi:hypothetical protein
MTKKKPEGFIDAIRRTGRGIAVGARLTWESRPKARNARKSAARGAAKDSIQKRRIDYANQILRSGARFTASPYSNPNTKMAIKNKLRKMR